MAWLEMLEVTRISRLSRWINYDIRPIEPGRRTWGYVSFHNYWLLISMNISTYLTGSALIPLGLTWWQAIISIVIGHLFATLFVILNSLPGAYYNLGFPVVNRMTWGLWGAQFVIWNRIFLSLVWYGFTAWVGGECVYVMLQSWDPNLEKHIPNHMPANTGMTTAQFVAYIVFSVVSLPIIYIRPHKLQKFFYAASSVTIVFFLVLLIWALATMGPAGFGSTIQNSTDLEQIGGPNSVAWLMVYGIVSTIGSLSAGILNQNDYARFATTPKHAILGQAIPSPPYGILCSVIGILVTAATQNRLGGEPVWNPPALFSKLIELDPSPGTRAGAFFAGLALVISQIGVNVPGNALGGGFDLAATFPKYINIRRGAYITAILSVIVNPWKLVNTATIFLTVLSSYSIFLGPMTGMMVASYLVVYKKKINVDDLYRGDQSSIYWFTGGINWRAAVAWIIGFAPLLPGFIAAVNTSVSVSDGATNLYQLSYFYGFLASGIIFILLHKIFPARKLDAFVNDGVSPEQTRFLYQEKWDSVGYEDEDAALSVEKEEGVIAEKV
ncbi:permease for cytosine/purines, uracil, thiamine, allantoin-domain-containing protein [Xylariaceae sp. FL1272]|nr:permease for cytosine/purines, uracil, thiamine, allantoin-domain-containing protein [Xylariaceae sp. FL1272]